MAMTVATVEPGIIYKLGNRGDLKNVLSNGQTRLYAWIQKAVNELTDNYQFEDLVITGAIKQFVANQATYTKNFFTTGNEDWTDIRNWCMWLTVSGSAPTEGDGNIKWNLEGRDTQVVTPFTSIAGPPKYWAQDGGNLIVGLCPNQAYWTRQKYQKKHPWSTPVVNTDTIFMPDAWQEVVEVATALRGAIELRASDYISLYDQILNGNEDFQRTGGKEGKPGLIFGLVSQQQRNKVHNSRQLAPTVPRYGAR